MPITGQEKLQVHSLSSTDLAAVPIKKRRFFFPRSPSPPCRSPSPTPADYGILEKESESSELGASKSKTGVDSAQVNTVTGEVTFHESRGLQLQTPADWGLSEKNPESSWSGSPFSKSEGNLSQVDIITGKVGSPESHESPFPAPAVGCMPEKKPELAKCEFHAVSESDCTRVTATIAENAFSEPCKSPLALVHYVQPEKKLESQKPGSPVSKAGVTPAEANTLTGKGAPCKPCELPSPMPTDCSMIARKPESSVSPFSVISHNLAQVNCLTGKDASNESSEVPKTGSLNIVPKHEILPPSGVQGSGFNFAASAHNGTGNGQQMVVNSKFATLPVTGSMVTVSAAKPTFDMPGRVGRVEGKFTPCQGISVKQEEPEQQNLTSKSGDTKNNVDSGNLCLNRSNWDLNTTMDAWEGSSTGTSLKDGTADHDRQDLEGKQNKGLELGLGQSLFKDAILGDHRLQKSDHRLMFSNPTPITSMVDSNTEAHIQLHLKPSSLSNPSLKSGIHGAIKEIPFLSLGMKPVSSTTSTPLAIYRTVKFEPIEGVQKDMGKVQLGVEKFLDMKSVKSEPSEGQPIFETARSGHLNLACSRGVKLEPLEDQYQGNSRTEGSSFHMGQKSLPQGTQMHQNADKDMVLEMASKPQVLNGVLDTCTKRPDTNISSVSSDMVDKTQEFANPPLILENEMSISTTVTQGSNGIVTEPSSSVSNSMISDGNDLNSILEPCAPCSLPLRILPESLTCSGEGHVSVEGVPKCDFKLDPSNDQHPANLTLTDEGLVKPCGNGNIVESDEVEGKVEVSSEIPEELCDNTCKSGDSPAANGAVNAVRKLGGKRDEDFEDGEVRYPALNGIVGGSSGISEKQQVNDSNSISSVGLAVSKPLLGDEQEVEAESSKDINAFGSKEEGGGLLEGKVEPGSTAVGAPVTDSGEQNPSETICKNPEDQQKHNEGLGKKLKSSGLSTKTNLSDSQSDSSGSKQQNEEGPKLTRSYFSRRAEHSEMESVKKDSNDRSNNKKIIYLNSASNCVSSGKRKSTLDRFMPSRGERGRPVERSFRGKRSHSRGSRDDSGNERSRKVESERHYGHPGEKRRLDLIHTRGRAKRLAALHGDRNSNAEHLIEEINSSTGVRYSRPVNAGEIAIGKSPEGSNRLGRKLTNEEMQNISRLPPRQRQSPEGRVQRSLGRHMIGRDVPDFLLLAHEEKLLRNLPEDMVEQSMLSHRRSQYERGGDILIGRERRSLSPLPRRAGPLQLSSNGLNSSPRSQQRSARQWSPSRRPQDGFSGPRELVRCRSPPIMRLNRMQPPLENSSFPEEIMLRGRGSPPHYISRLPNGMADLAPSREHDFPPRLMRGLNRNMRRFNAIDPAEEEFIPRGDIREFGVDDEFGDGRRLDERRGHVRSFRQRCIAGDNENESFRFHAEDGPPRALRLRHDANEGFPEGNGPRDFDVRFRNRLGNTSGRRRSIVEEQEEENYRHHAEQEWRDSAFSDARPKRRRF